MSTTIPNPSVYAPGADITGQTTAAVTANRFLKISADRTAAGNISVATATAGGRIFGVAAHDAASGGLVRVVRGGGRVVKVLAAANIAAFAEVEVGADGKAITKDTGIAVGYAVTGATSASLAQVSLY